MKNIKIIIVEDELIAAEFLKEILEKTGAEVIDIIDNGKEAIKTCIEKKPDVIFMDVMLRDSISGSEAALAISKENSESKIIFLTAYVDEEMIDYAAESKAINYLTKPYNEAQILATLKLAVASKVTRQPIKKEQNQIDLIDDYVYLVKEKRLLKDGKEVGLGARSLKLVELLCSQPNISISNEQISMYIWGKIVNDKTLRSLMYRIRSLTNNDLIKNVSGTGYMIQSKNHNN